MVYHQVLLRAARLLYGANIDKNSSPNPTHADPYRDEIPAARINIDER